MRGLLAVAAPCIFLCTVLAAKVAWIWRGHLVRPKRVQFEWDAAAGGKVLNSNGSLVEASEYEVYPFDDADLADCAKRTRIPAEVCAALRVTTLPHSKEFFSKTHSPGERQWQEGFSFLRISRVGGTSMQYILNREFQADRPITRLQNFESYKWIALFRDPVARLASVYWQRINGESDRTSTYMQWQLQLCKKKTGKAYKCKCRPKVSLYDFAMNIFGGKKNLQWLCAAGPGVPSCTDFDIWKILLKHFWLAAPMSRLLEVQVLLVEGLGLSSWLTTNPVEYTKGSHPPFQESLNQTELEKLEEVHACDVKLVQAAQGFMSQLVFEYGEEKMKTHLAKLQQPEDR